MRESDFSGSTFNGAYLEKAVAYKANFSGMILPMDIFATSMDNDQWYIKVYTILDWFLWFYYYFRCRFEWYAYGSYGKLSTIVNPLWLILWAYCVS